MDLLRQNLRVELIRPSLNALPEAPFPPGYSLRWFHSGDAAHWLRIHHDADPFNEISPELFNRQFGTDQSRLEQCQCFVQDAIGRVVGTGTAWSAADRSNELWGRVYWLAVLRQYQGRGLGKPLLATVCNRMRELGYNRACVVTSTGRLPAIGLYLQFGFQPEIRTDAEQDIWDQVLGALRERGRLHQPAAAA
jgi:ribosomal protein S18 acetylase RimI-like enzyme